MIVFSLMQRAAERIGRKKEFSVAGYPLKLAQDRDGLRRQRDAMRALHFHFFGWNRPNSGVQIEFRPFRRAKFAGANKGQGSNSSAARVSGEPS